MRKTAKNIKKIISFVIVLILFISSIPLYEVKGNVKNDIGGLVSKGISETKKIAEAKIDASSKKSAGDWNTATKIDHLPWNYFHNKVQKHIVDKYFPNMTKEKSVDFVINDDKKIKGLKGSADLVLMNEDYNYVWEVKPYSYFEGEKRDRARRQLNGYVKSFNAKSEK